jgi:hypothetical protein
MSRRRSAHGDLVRAQSLRSGQARLLAKYLKKIVVKVIHLHEFRPTKTKVEKSDIEGLVGEFRKFLEKAVYGDGKGQSTILEIK